MVRVKQGSYCHLVVALLCLVGSRFVDVSGYIYNEMNELGTVYYGYSGDVVEQHIFIGIYNNNITAYSESVIGYRDWFDNEPIVLKPAQDTFEHITSNVYANVIEAHDLVVVTGAFTDSEIADLNGAMYIWWESVKGAKDWNEDTNRMKLYQAVGIGDGYFGINVATDSLHVAASAPHIPYDGSSNVGYVYVFTELTPGNHDYSSEMRLEVPIASNSAMLGKSGLLIHGSYVMASTKTGSAWLSGTLYIFIETSIGALDWNSNVFALEAETPLDNAYFASGNSFQRRIAKAGMNIFVGEQADVTVMDGEGAVHVYQEATVGVADGNFVRTMTLTSQEGQVTNYVSFGYSVDAFDNQLIVGSGAFSAIWLFTETVNGAGDWSEEIIFEPQDGAGQTERFGQNFVAVHTDIIMTSAYNANGGTGKVYVWNLCRLGFSGAACEINIDDCVAHSCVTGSTCVDGVLEYTCACSEGFTGEFCDTDIDDCASSPCKNGATCIDVGTNAFECTCESGFEGDLCSTDVDDCASSPCVNDGVCSDTGTNMFECDCNDTGFEGNVCATDVDDCASSPCINDGVCTDAGPHAFACDCTNTGFHGSICGTDIDDCVSSPCMNSGVCSDAGNALFTCDCTGTGYEGATCATDVDDCISSPCQNGAACIDTGNNAFKCDCTKTGFEGEMCNIDVNDCLSSPCLHGGSCEDHGRNMFQCSCATGFDGIVCERNINDCNSSPCFHGATCIDRIANVTCLCSNGYEGVLCDVDVDDCISMPCESGEVCVDELAGFTCTAPLDPCLSAPCQHDGQCWTYDGDMAFVCDCADGYEGYTCEDTSSPQEYPIEIVISFGLHNATIADVIEILPSAVTASQDDGSNNEVTVTLVTVPEGYPTDHLVIQGYPEPIPVQQGNSDEFSVTIQYANTEQTTPEEVERRIQASPVPDETTDFSIETKVTVPLVNEYEENAGVTIFRRLTQSLLVIAITIMAIA